MKILFVFFIIFLLISCNHLTRPQILSFDCPELKLPPDPKSSVFLLNEKSSYDEIMKSWIATAVAYRDWNRIVRQQVDDSN